MEEAVVLCHELHSQDRYEEIIAGRGEAAEDKSAAPRTAVSEPLAHSGSRKPLPTSTAVPRADGTFEDEDTEFLRRARGGTLNPPSLTGRPLVLRPNNPSYPQVVVNSEGTWVRVSQPPGVTSREPSTVPTHFPGPADHNTDLHNLPDEVWRDPSLIGSNTALVTSHQTEVIPIVDPVSEAEVEAEAATESELEPFEEAAPKRRSPRKRPIASVASAGRRVVYARRRFNPQSTGTCTSVHWSSIVWS